MRPATSPEWSGATATSSRPASSSILPREYAAPRPPRERAGFVNTPRGVRRAGQLEVGDGDGDKLEAGDVAQVEPALPASSSATGRGWRAWWRGSSGRRGGRGRGGIVGGIVDVRNHRQRCDFVCPQLEGAEETGARGVHRGKVPRFGANPILVRVANHRENRLLHARGAGSKTRARARDALITRCTTIS